MAKIIKAAEKKNPKENTKKNKDNTCSLTKINVTLLKRCV